MIAAVALAVTLEGLGPARAISHSSSASRDTMVLGIVAAPHRILSGGGDFALVSLGLDGLTLRLGAHAMLELESEGETTSYLPFPQSDIKFWRGIWGFSAVLALDDAARRLCPRCTLEVTLTGRHESEHETGGNNGGPGTDYSDARLVGNFVMVDAAARLVVGEVDLVGRLQQKVFIRGAGGAYTAGTGADLELRWRRWPRLQPFDSLFAEYNVGIDRFPSTFLVRDLAGVVIPSPHGDIYLFVCADIGNRKGLAVLAEEATLGFGARFAFY